VAKQRKRVGAGGDQTALTDGDLALDTRLSGI
jgi:hypothetical protein